MVAAAHLHQGRITPSHCGELRAHSAGILVGLGNSPLPQQKHLSCHHLAAARAPAAAFLAAAAARTASTAAAAASSSAAVAMRSRVVWVRAEADPAAEEETPSESTGPGTSAGRI